MARMPARDALVHPWLGAVLVAWALVGCGSSASGGDSGATPADDVPADDVPAADLASTPVTIAGSFQARDGVSTQALTVGGTSREVILLAPASRAAHPPLLIAFHGTSGSPTDWVDLDPGSDPMGLEALATANGIVVAAPRARDWGDGMSDWDNHGGNDRYWETGFDANPARGRDPDANADIVLVKGIIDAAVAAYGVDPKRVYLVGFSNGGFFTSLAAFVLRERVAAFAEADSGLVACVSTGGCELKSSSKDCTAILAAAASTCPDCDGAGHPLDPPADGRKVPGFLGHRNQDDVVSVVHTCRLDARMRAAGFGTQTLITAEEGHGLPEGFLEAAIPFLLGRTLP